MNIEQQIYTVLINHAKGVQDRISGISKPTLIKMKRGEGRTKFSELFKVLFDNGIENITLTSKETIMQFDVKGKGVEITTKSIKKL